MDLQTTLAKKNFDLGVIPTLQKKFTRTILTFKLRYTENLYQVKFNLDDMQYTN